MFSWDFAFVGGTEIDGQAQLGFELRIARFFALEAQRIKRGDRHALEGGGDELPDLRISAADGQRDAIEHNAERRFLEAVFALQQFEFGGARESVHALELVRKLLQRGKQSVETTEFLRAALARNGLKRGARAQALGDREPCPQLALRRADRRKIKRDAENADPDAEHSGRPQPMQPVPGGPHRLILKAACTAKWYRPEG